MLKCKLIRKTNEKDFLISPAICYTIYFKLCKNEPELFYNYTVMWMFVSLRRPDETLRVHHYLKIIPCGMDQVFSMTKRSNQIIHLMYLQFAATFAFSL